MSMLEIKNVHKSFFTYTKPRLQAGIFHRPGARKVTSELQVLRGVDLTVEKGDVVAILGPSGSGKTTLLRCLNFLETADAGQLTFDGETFDLAQASRADIARLRKKTAFVFQSYNLFRNKTALQNVTEGLIIARKMPKEQADAVGMKMLERWALPTEPTTIRASFPAASSSAWPLPVRWHLTRRSSILTSRLRPLTRS